MDLKKINELFEDLDVLKGAKLISTNESDDYYEEKDQGTVGLKVEIYNIGETDVFLKVVKNTDSYGSEEKVVGLQFVTAVEKTITTYI